ncbi:MAG: redoxin domain-containing protein [Planctomycetes bacterium]|nr:redoxin domain-containing protein [Planctomycetota bacterium]
MRNLFSAIVVLAALASTSTLLAAEKTPGVEVGKKAPAFKLKDQKGKERTLEALLKKSNVALVFYRSADW